MKEFIVILLILLATLLSALFLGYKIGALNKAGNMVQTSRQVVCKEGVKTTIKVVYKYYKGYYKHNHHKGEYI